MTGRYEEPEPRHDATWQSTVGAGGNAQQPNGTAGPGGHASHAEQQADPAAPAPLYVDPSVSGPYQLGGGPSGPYQVGGGTSGPYQVSGGSSGPYQVGGGYSGPHQVSGGPSGPHSVGGGPSGPYQVAGGASGPHRVDGSQYVESGPSGPQQAQPYPHQAPQQGRQGNQELSSAQLLRQQKRPPQSGWRRAVYVATGHLVNLGESPADLRRRDLIARINQPLRGCYRIAMLSLKGGVGKTTTTASLGATFASLRGDRVIAVDANPDRGTLAQKIPLETTATVRHLLRDAKRITRYSDVRAYTSQGPSRLEVLASEQDPAVSEAFSEDDYRRTVALLEHFYNIVLTDCGTGLMHSAMKGVLDLADSLIIVSSGSVDGARSASATVDWLDAHGYRDLVSRSVAVINSVRPRSGKVNLDRLAEHFAARCRAVCRVPFDPHLEEGAEIELDRLAPATRLALLELAATVADDFPNDTGRRR
ncbi:MinD/ParA family ATP-binding protein [Gandjariella thermophila]|uniref:ATPase n=1 Tax=Gandjariella thermophila TaxID=1931992 RepID=A0A4D4J2R7_9PSEU|nr:MinD/ParA family protein [Gandjariella thermophila]GDY29450.1 ATPase [Gandjariella thermophila]